MLEQWWELLVFVCVSFCVIVSFFIQVQQFFQSSMLNGISIHARCVCNFPSLWIVVVSSKTTLLGSVGNAFAMQNLLLSFGSRVQVQV